MGKKNINLKNFINYLQSKFFSIREYFYRDKITSIRIGQFELFLDKNHALPRYLINRPSYGDNLPMLVEKVFNKYPKLIFIDIGANVGDTVAFLKSRFNCPIICIEGDDFYYSFLKKNCVQFRDVYIYKYFLSDKNEIIEVNKNISNGTLNILSQDENNQKFTISTITMDNFFTEHKEFASNTKMIKIDTDGYDFKILRGGINFIKENLPVLFFEYDRYFLSKVNEDGLSIFKSLKEIGYHYVLFFDNVGRFLLSLKIDNFENIEQLYNYTYKKEGSFPFYDVCVFPKADDDVAQSFILEVQNRYHENIV